MFAAGILCFLTLALVALGALEYRTHQTNRDRIEFRIHVNGTRGKSSVTRLIAAGLRAGGITTCAKTTGTTARMIFPDAQEFPIYRPAGANIIEQVRIVRAAARQRARALVIECMALQPLLQSLSEFKLVRATHAVITNVRPDHLDVMGPTDHDVGLAMAAMIPPGGVCYTSEVKHGQLLRDVCADRAAELVYVDPLPDDAELTRFSYVEHRDNVALALRVCMDLGVDRATALNGMISAAPDPGAMTTHEVNFFGRRLVFVNALAANDEESTEYLWDLAIKKYPDIQKRVALFNCRIDRSDRTRRLAQACARWTPADHYLLMGTGTYLFARTASKAGVSALRFVLCEDRTADQIFEQLVSLAGASVLVVGMGNIGGGGLELVQYFRNRSAPEVAWRNT